MNLLKSEDETFFQKGEDLWKKKKKRVQKLKVTYLNAADCSKKGLGHLKSSRKSSGHRNEMVRRTYKTQRNDPTIT